MRIHLIALIILFASCESLEEKLPEFDNLSELEPPSDSLYIAISINDLEPIHLSDMAHGRGIGGSNKSFGFGFGLSHESELSIDVDLRLNADESDKVYEEISNEELLEILHIGQWEAYQGIDNTKNRSVSITLKEFRFGGYHNSKYDEEEHILTNDYNLKHSSFVLEDAYIESNSFIKANYGLEEVIRIKGSFQQILYKSELDSIAVSSSFEAFLYPN